jgi:drug/metabolite transporter (DMT)-like permease
MRAETQPERAAAAGALMRVVLAGACWAFAAVLAKYAFEHGVAPVRLAEARVAVAGAALAPVLAWRRPELLRPPAGAWPVLAGFGASVAAVNLTYYVAIDHLPVGVAIALQYTGPAMLMAATALLAVRGRRTGEEVGRLAWVAAGLTLTGAVLVSRALEGLGALDLPGLAAGLASAVLFATYLVTAERAGRRGAEPATTLLWGFLIAVAIWAVVAPWWSWPLSALADPKVAAAVVGVGLVGTLLPFALAVGAVRVISAATAGIAATSEPVFAVVFAWVLLGQRLNLAQLAGAALVVAGVVLAQLASASRGAAGRRGRPGSRPGTGTPPPTRP